MQLLEAILVGGIIALSTGFLLRTFWPKGTSAKKDETTAPSCQASCGCADRREKGSAPVSGKRFALPERGRAE